MVKVSVIVINHNSNKDTLECINNVNKSITHFPFEVFIIDNSDKISLKRIIYKKNISYKYIESENKGYGSGNNLGIKNAKGDYILVLNPDCRVQNNTIQILSDFLDRNKKVGAVAPNLIDQKGNIFTQLGSRELTPLRGIFALSFLNKIFPNNKFSKEYYLHDKSFGQLRETDAITGFCFYD